MKSPRKVVIDPDQRQTEHNLNVIVQDIYKRFPVERKRPISIPIKRIETAR